MRLLHNSGKMHRQNLIDGRLFQWSDLSWKPRIVMRVVAGLIGHPRARQASARSDETVDAPPRPLAPADIERGGFGKELQRAGGEMIVDPPRHRPPIHAGRMVVGEPW